MINNQEIKIGSEWFHLESLTVVTISSILDDDFGKAILVMPTLSSCGVIAVNPEAFLENYLPNEPITPELLNRIGWTLQSVDNRTCLFYEKDDRDILLWWHNNVPYVTKVCDKGEYVITVKFPKTLRDLVNLLEVLDVEYNIKDIYNGKEYTRTNS